MNISDMKKLIQILEDNGYNDKSYFDFDHDVIYIPVFDKDPAFVDQLRAIDCLWNSEIGCWYHF